MWQMRPWLPGKPARSPNQAQPEGQKQHEAERAGTKAVGLAAPFQDTPSLKFLPPPRKGEGARGQKTKGLASISNILAL